MSARLRLLLLLLPLLLLTVLGGSAAGAQPRPTTLPAAEDLAQAARQATNRGTPLIILYSRQDCKYCETVRRDYLLPMVRQTPQRLVIQQINQDSDAALIDFRGEKTTHAQFSSREKVKLVPVVAFYDATGKRLVPPIVGLRLPDFYQSYLDSALEQAESALKTR